VVKHTRGLTMIECMVALSILTIATTGIVLNDRGTLQTAADSFDSLAASRYAAGHLDARSRVTLTAGTREWALDDPALPACTAVETVRETNPGLFEVELRVRHADGREFARVATLMRAEVSR